MPELEKRYGPIVGVDFLRQEMKKHWLSDKGRELDIPIRYTFKNQQVVISLIEHQSDKRKFDIFKLAHYTLDMKKAYPNNVILPIVIFADASKWRKQVQQEIKIELDGEVWLYFKFHKVKLKEIPASLVETSDNPVLHILTPLLDYPSDERLSRTLGAYIKLNEQLTPRLFEKYLDMLDAYAN